jgi:endonuclease YncB( thermonuclease family)
VNPRHHLEYDYAAALRRVVDGDTFDLALSMTVTTDIGFHIIETTTHTTVQRVRLLGVDCPDSRDSGFREATRFTAGWLEEHAGTLRCRTVKSDSFGRYLGDIYSTRTLKSLNVALLNAGHAVEWQAGRWMKLTVPDAFLYWVERRAG